MNLKLACWLVFLLGGLETRRLSFAFGGQRSFFEPNMHRSFREPVVLIARVAPPGGSQLASFLALSPPKLRLHLFRLICPL